MSKLADRYAVALFEVTQENNSSAQVYRDLKNVLDSLSDHKILTYFKARDIDRQEKIKVLENSFSDENQEILGLLKLLVRNHRFRILPEIFKSYEDIHYKHENIKIADVKSATQLNQDEIDRLSDALEKKYESKIDLRLTVDQTLLQGLVIKIEDEILDNSLKSKFNQLQKRLLAGGRQHGH